MSDQITIDIENPAQLTYWAAELNATEERLKEMVNKVGPAVDDVRMELSKTSK